jgi:hypothetical protein
MLNMFIVVFGPPGFLWKVPNIKETLSYMTVMKLRLCHAQDKFDTQNAKPSGSFLRLATNAKIDTRQFECKCKVQITDHILDWYGREQERAEWRKTMSSKYIKLVCDTLASTTPTFISCIILDDVISPSPIPASIAAEIEISDNEPTLSGRSDFRLENNEATVYPTEARVRQKERLKTMKAAGLKPKKKPQVIEAGNDDCGDDISGLGADVFLLGFDYMEEDIDSSDDDEQLFITIYRDEGTVTQPIPHSINDHTTNVYSAVASLCYGTNGYVDLIELCGGPEGRISQVAFNRGLTSGGNLDIVTGCDLGDPNVQKALFHYLDKCYVLVTVLQPNCRSTGKLSNFNAIHYHDTWDAHHKEDLPHIKLCGAVAEKQMELNRYWLREQPTGTWIDEIEPWSRVAKHKDVIHVLHDQCMTGLVDDMLCPVQKTTEWSSNTEILLEPTMRWIP